MRPCPFLRFVSAWLLGAMVGAIAACVGSRPQSPEPTPTVTVTVTSNITRADYAGSSSCKACHAELFARWQSAPMHRMTRDANTAEIHAPFDGRAFTFKDDVATLETVDGVRYLRLTSRFGNGLYRVTKVIGGNHREDFAGVEVSQEGGVPIGSPHTERVLPISYLIERGELRYKGYSVMATERPGMKAAPVWNQTCIFCHNTEPYLDTLFGTLLGALPGERPPGYQGETVDTLLPESRRQHFVVDDEASLRRALGDEIRFENGPFDTSSTALPALLKDAITTTRTHFDETKLVEIGIGCEACHGGAKEHVDDPSKHPSMRPTAPILHTVGFGLGSQHDDATNINRVCVRCHQVLFSGYRATWEGGHWEGSDRGHDLGGSSINSGEGRDFLLGGCAGAMSCADCHDPHAEDGHARSRDVETLAGNRICTRCHTEKIATSALTAHTHHAPTSDGSVCVRCHMPRKNVALDTTLGPYHRIGSPTDKVRVEHDRPLECALCHVDKSASSLVETMEAWWSKSYDRDALRVLYGDLSGNAMRSTLSHGKPHEQAVAIYTLGVAGDRAAAAAIGAQMTGVIPLVRYYARDALERIFGEKSPVNMHTFDDAIRDETARWLARNGVQSMPVEKSAPPAREDATDP